MLKRLAALLVLLAVAAVPTHAMAALPGYFTVYVRPTYFVGEHVVVTWSTSAYATKYGLSVWRPPFFVDSSLVWDGYTSGMSSQDVGALPQGNYAVNMKGYNSSGGGPQSNIAYFNVVPDTTPPSTGSDVVGAYSAIANIHLSASDVGIGVAHIYYRLDAGAQIEASSLTVSKLGAHSIEYWASDGVGNVSAHATRSFTVYATDTTKPHTSVSLASSYPGTTTVTLKPADNSGGCGVARTFYVLDSGASREGTRVTIVGLGTHKLVYWSVDRLGNTETQHTGYVVITRPKAGTPALSAISTGLKVSGYINRRYASGTSPVRIRAYYRSSLSKAWTYKWTVSDSVSNATYGRSYYSKVFSASRLTRGYWCFKAYTVADASHYSSAYSGSSKTAYRR